MDIIPFHQMHTGSHQERRSLCSGSHCDQCGWSSACSWPGSTPTEESQTSVKAMQYTVIVMLSFRCFGRALISKKNASENCQVIHAINFKSLGKLQKTNLFVKQNRCTFTILSQPQETMMGLLLLGEKRTQETHSEWLSSCRKKAHKVCISTKLVYIGNQC